MNNSYAVDIDALTHRYGRRIALDGVSIRVRAGTLFGLLGPNGGGKTTMFRILSTAMVPSGGTARIAGADVVTQRDQVRSRIGVAFQSPSLDRHLTVLENLRCQGNLYGLAGRELSTRIDQLLPQFNLQDRATEKVTTLSGGLQRRVELCKALLHRPAVLLLDEPATGLDPHARRELTRLLTQVRDADGTTVLLTTHLMTEADCCDHLAILDQGRLVAADTPDNLKSSVRGDVIRIKSAEPETLCREMGADFGGQPTVVEGEVRLEVEAGHKVLTRLIDAHSARIQAVSVGKPTLEDVFIDLTGHRFDAEKSAEVNP
ncbi:MAG: ATP-binding cassette domain-containing protein [Phycisphaerae bacterium]